MQIFNWMNKKLCPISVYQRVSHNKDIFYIKEDLDDAKLETDTNGLLLHNAFDSILTIGTLGDLNDQPFATPSPWQCRPHDDTIIEEEEEDVISSKPVLIETTLIVARRKSPPAADTEPRKPDHSSAESEDAKKETTTEEAEAGRNSAVEVVEPLLKEDRKKRDKRRPTLAQLFTESDATEASNKNNSGISAVKKTSIGASSDGTQHVPCRAKHGRKVASTKKGKEAPLPMAKSNAKKLNQLITRMLKKKIHPWEAARGGETHRMEAEPLVGPRKARVTAKTGTAAEP